MSEEKQGIYEFHNCRLDIGKAVLLREKQPITLQRKTFDLLCALVRSNGALMTRNQLMEELWADTFVEDNNLSQHIRALRKALGEHSNEIRFIETVPGRGYRFLPDVNMLETETAPFFETHVLDSGAEASSFHLERLGTNYALPVSPGLIYENERVEARFVTPPAASRSLLLRNPIAGALVVTLFIAGIAAWNSRITRDNSRHRRLVYANQINLAAEAWESANLSLMKEQLDISVPRSGQKDLRGFEWYYLSRLYEQNESALSMTLQYDNIVGGIAHSPDGQTLATAGWDNKLRLFSSANGQQTATLNGHTDRIGAVAFSPDGKTLATGGYDRTVKLWNAATGQELFSVELDPEFAGLHFFADGRIIAAVDGQTTRFWEVATGREINKFFPSLMGDYLLLGFSSDGKTAAIRSDAVAVNLVDIASGRVFATVKGHTDLVADVRFSPDGKTFATGSWDGTAKLWEVRSGRELFTLEGHKGRLYDIAFSHDGKLLATGGTADHTVKLWNTYTGAEIAAFKGHDGEITSLSFSPDGIHLAAGSDKTVRVWNVPQNQSTDLLMGHTEPVKAIVFAPNGKILATASNDRTIKLWDVTNGQVIRTLKGHADLVNSAAFSSDGKILATGGDDKLLKFWEIATGQGILSIECESDISTVAFSPDDKIVATGHWQEYPFVALWNAADGQLIGTLRGHTGRVWSVVFSADGKQLATAGEDDTVRLWNVKTHQELSIYRGSSDANYGVAFSPDGKVLILEGNKNRTISLLRMTGEEMIAFKGNADEIISFAFSAEGKRLITGGWNGNGRMWDAVSGQELLKFKASGVAFSPDGKTIAASNGRMVQLLRASSGRE